MVVFDLGGVIIRIHHSWQHAAVAAGVLGGNQGELDPSIRAQLDPSSHRAEEFHSLVSEHQRGVLSHDVFCQRVGDLTAGHLSALDVERVHHAVIVGAYDGAEGLLLELKTRGVPTACLSNTNARHWERMSALPAFEAIQHKHASHLFGMEKPHPAIFKAFESATGARPVDILFFDDLAENISAASQAGWSAVWIDPSKDTVSQMRTALATRGVLPC